MNGELKTGGGGQPSDMLYPSFIVNRADGVFVDLAHADAVEEGMERFVDRLFAAGARFSGLNYDLFLKLLYDPEWMREVAKATPSLKIAESIVRFQDQRRTLYRNVKLDDKHMRADYVFEPIHVEETYQEPVYGPAGPDGVIPIVGHETKTREVAARLDFDEMVADMWLKKVRFGLREETIRKLIASGETARIPIAMHADPDPSIDAEIIEVCDKLHRDNSPEIGAHGKANLAVYKNRFPHVAAGTRLLKKVPRKLGKPGHKVTGEIIEPEAPKDLDLGRLASSGTIVEHFEDGEYIVAKIDGFIGIDSKSNRISVTEKIETKEGISAKTTGDLALNAEEFVEHGEVQEGRTVRGKHMTFLADVFGNIISDGGNIFISGNVAGGRIESLGGNVTLGARMTRAVAVARDGELTVAHAENSQIMGMKVKVEHAINCVIVAEELEAELVEASVIVAKSVRIKSSSDRRGTETLVTMLVPDSSGLERQIDELNRKQEESRTSLAAKVAEAEALKADPDFARFLSLYAKIQKGEIKLTEEQSANWQKLVSRNAKTLQQYATLNRARAEIEQGIWNGEEEIAAIRARFESMSDGIGCAIEKIDGHTVGQILRTDSGTAPFYSMNAATIRNGMHTMDASKERIFTKDDGAVDWKLKTADAAEQQK